MVALVAILAVVASVALHFLLPPEKAKALVLKQLKTQLRREVKIGDISIGILKGLHIHDLQVSESPDFSKGTFISSEQFSLRVALVPLLFRKVILRQVSLIQPTISIVRMPDGKTFNFSDLTQSTTTATSPSKEREKPPFMFLVSHAAIEKGALHFVDRSPAAQSMDISDLDLKLKNVSLVSPFRLDTSMRVKTKAADWRVELSGDANLAAASLKIRDCRLSSKETKLALSGMAEQLRSDQPTIDILLDIPQLHVANLAPFATLPPDVKLSGPLSGRAALKGHQRKLLVDSNFDLTKTDVKYSASFTKAANVPFSAAFKGTVLDMQGLSIENAKLVLVSMQVSGSGQVGQIRSPQPHIDLQLESNAFPVSDIAALVPQALPKGIAWQGSTQFSARVTGTPAASHVSLKWDGKPLSITLPDTFSKPIGTALDVNAQLDVIQPSQIQIRSFSGHLGSMQMTGSASYVTRGAQSTIGLAMKTNTFSVAEMAAMIPKTAPYKPGGNASLEVRVSGTADAPAVNGSMILQDVSAAYERSQITRLSGPVTFSMQDVVAPKLAGKLNGSEFALKLAAHKISTHPDIQVDFQIGELDLNKILPPMEALQPAKPSASVWFLVPPAYAATPEKPMPPMTIAATCSIGRAVHDLFEGQKIEFKAKLTDVTPDLSKVNGTATLRGGAGKLKNVEKLVSLSSTAKLVLLPISILQKLEHKGILKGLGIPSLQMIPFNSLKGDYALRSGTMEVQTFDLDGHDLAIQTKGTIGLIGAQPLNLKVATRLMSGVIAGTLGQLVRDESGHPTIKFSVTGTAADPHAKLDVQEVGKKAVQEVGKELLKNKDVQNAVDGLEKTFKNIFR